MSLEKMIQILLIHSSLNALPVDGMLFDELDDFGVLIIQSFLKILFNIKIT